MDFLNKAIFSSMDQGLLGLIITEFDPNDITGRASVQLFTAEDLTNGTRKLTPRGFKFNDDGILMSDTASRQVIADSVFSYISSESLKFGPACFDVTDLVLLGIKHKGFVLPNFPSDGEEATEQYDGVVIPFSKFYVSNSSFNIYARYQQTDESFRTFSLLSLEDGSPDPFYCALPVGVLPAGLQSTVIAQKTLQIDGREMEVYHVTCGLQTFYTEVGEAFLNYLAYNVAFYDIGEKLAHELKSIVPAMPKLPTETKVVYEKRKPLINVSIQHIYKETRLGGMTDILGDTNQLIEYLTAFPEAAISYQWLQRILSSPWVKNPSKEMSEEMAIYTASLNILNDCRAERLKYALELLRHRYYIAMMGVGNDTLGTILTGGGVSGQSFKRSSF